MNCAGCDECSADAAAPAETTAAAPALEAESQLALHDARTVKTPEGQDSGKSCRQAFIELQEATEDFLQSCPPSLQMQCPAYCNSAEVTGYGVEVAALDQTILPVNRYQYVLLGAGALTVLTLVAAFYYYCFSRKGDKLDVEYLLLDQDEYGEYMDEF